jgi:hypothetical protein
MCSCVLSWKITDVFEEHWWTSIRLHDIAPQMTVLFCYTEPVMYHTETASSKNIGNYLYDPTSQKLEYGNCYRPQVSCSLHLSMSQQQNVAIKTYSAIASQVLFQKVRPMTRWCEMMINTVCPALNVNKIKHYICKIRADTKLWTFSYSAVTLLKFFSCLVNSHSLHKCVHVWRSSILNGFPIPEGQEVYYMQQKMDCDHVALRV